MDHVVDSLGNLTEDVARRVTKAVQHYEDRVRRRSCRQLSKLTKLVIYFKLNSNSFFCYY